MNKTCPHCKKSLSVEEFNWKIKNIRRSVYCKKCSREYVKNHYENHRAYYIQKAKRRNIALKKGEQNYILSYLKIQPCVDCGETDIRVLEFDHRNRNKKTDSVSLLMRRRLPINDLIREIEKCDVRCANCHRKKTARESKSWRLFLPP
jgi:Zn finger protein HypA/HybF involved in hydrogenase expression